MIVWCIFGESWGVCDVCCCVSFCFLGGLWGLVSVCVVGVVCVCSRGSFWGLFFVCVLDWGYGVGECVCVCVYVCCLVSVCVVCLGFVCVVCFFVCVCVFRLFLGLCPRIFCVDELFLFRFFLLLIVCRLCRVCFLGIVVRFLCVRLG